MTRSKDCYLRPETRCRSKLNGLVYLIINIGIVNQFLICEWMSVVLRQRPNAWDDFKEVLPAGFSTKENQREVNFFVSLIRYFLIISVYLARETLLKQVDQWRASERLQRRNITLNNMFPFVCRVIDFCSTNIIEF